MPGVALTKRSLDAIEPERLFRTRGGKGRKPSIDVARVQELKAQWMGATEIAKALKIHRASVYRLLEEAGA
jgi:DNA invertase Pin-like site-specific DNA recombinase